MATKSTSFSRAFICPTITNFHEVILTIVVLQLKDFEVKSNAIVYRHRYNPDADEIWWIGGGVVWRHEHTTRIFKMNVGVHVYRVDR